MGTVAPTTPAPAALWTLETAGEFLNVTDRSLRRYIADGRLPAYRIGSRQIRVRREDVEALLTPIPAANSRDGRIGRGMSAKSGVTGMHAVVRSGGAR